MTHTNLASFMRANYHIGALQFLVSEIEDADTRARIGKHVEELYRIFKIKSEPAVFCSECGELTSSSAGVCDYCIALDHVCLEAKYDSNQ